MDNKIIVSTSSKKAFELFMNEVYDLELVHIIKKKEDMYNVIMYSSVYNSKELKRLQDVMNNGMRSIERLLELKTIFRAH